MGDLQAINTVFLQGGVLLQILNIERHCKTSSTSIERVGETALTRCMRGPDGTSQQRDSQPAPTQHRGYCESGTA